MNVEETKALLQRLRHYGDNDRDAACALIEQLETDLYATEGRRLTLARQLDSANGCISDWVKFGAEVTEALGLKVMSPKDIKAAISRLIEDRARFPDRPDDIGRMIGSRFNNLKAEAKDNEDAWRRAQALAGLYARDAARWRAIEHVFHLTDKVGARTGKWAVKLSARWSAWVDGNHDSVTQAVDAYVEQSAAAQPAEVPSPGSTQDNPKEKT